MPRVPRNNSKLPAGSLQTEVAQKRVMIGVAASARRIWARLFDKKIVETGKLAAFEAASGSAPVARNMVGWGR
jgi:hypothetical protein